MGRTARTLQGGDGMSVLIDWDMPKACRDCFFQIGGWCRMYSDDEKRIDDMNLIVERPEWCPLVEVTE